VSVSAAQQLAGHIKRTIDGPMWHGPALAELLAGVTPEQAAARPVPGAHSIWELVLHLTAWAEIVRSRLAGTAAARVTTDEDWPPVGEATAAGWKAAVTRLGDAYRSLAADAGLLDDESLAKIVTGRDHSVSTMLHGVIEHGAYHGGQIAVMKRATEAGAASRPARG
jgi:uncharacterized damage-inducible protein DinB